MGVITPFITSRGPPCRGVSQNRNPPNLFSEGVIFFTKKLMDLVPSNLDTHTPKKRGASQKGLNLQHLEKLNASDSLL